MFPCLLTSLALGPSVPQGAVAAERPPQVDAGGSVLTGTVVAEVTLGRAP